MFGYVKVPIGNLNEPKLRTLDCFLGMYWDDVIRGEKYAGE